MGVLYYFQREGDDELFALNKVYHYAPDWIRGRDDWRAAPTLEEARAEVTDYPPGGWPDRIHRRLTDWAGGRRIRCISENYWDIYGGDEGPITGSAYDSDYEDDGVTYKPGSAW